MPLTEEISVEQNSKLETFDLQKAQKAGRRIEEMKTRFTEVGRALDELLPQIPEETREKMFQEIDLLEKGNSTPTQLLEKYKTADSTVQLAVAKYLEGSEILDAIPELRELHKPLIVKELTELAQDISDRFDFNALLSYYDAENQETNTETKGSLTNEFSNITNLRQVYVNAQNGTLSSEEYSQLDDWWSDLKKEAGEWQEKGFLKTQMERADVDVSVEKVTEKRSELRERLQKGSELLNEFEHLKERFRPSPQPFSNLDLKIFEELSNLLANDDKDAYDPRLLDSINGFVSRKVEGYVDVGLVTSLDNSNVYFERARSVEFESVLSTLSIKGLERTEDKLYAVTGEKLRQWLGIVVPAFFLRNVDIEITTEIFKDEEEAINALRTLSGDTSKSKNSVGGSFDPTFTNKGAYVHGKIETYKMPYVPDFLPEEKKPIFEERMFLTQLVHEIGHRVHSDLTYIDMILWDEIRETDKTAVSGYVKRMNTIATLAGCIPNIPENDTRLVNNKGSREDFSETFQMFILNPGFLQQLSPGRFNYMMDLAVRYMGENQRERFITYIQEELSKYTQAQKNTG